MVIPRHVGVITDPAGAQEVQSQIQGAEDSCRQVNGKHPEEIKRLPGNTISAQALFLREKAFENQSGEEKAATIIIPRMLVRASPTEAAPRRTFAHEGPQRHGKKAEDPDVGRHQGDLGKDGRISHQE